MSAARHVKTATAGIAECVTEDHLPLRWNYGTRPAKNWHWRAIRRCNPFPSLSNNTTTYCYLNHKQQLLVRNCALPTATTKTATSTADYTC
jgi:hypothetical protein